MSIADDPARRRDGDPSDDVLVGDLRVLRALYDLQLEESYTDDGEGQERAERHPAVAFAKLAHVRAGHEKGAHAIVLRRVARVAALPVVPPFAAERARPR